jgi:hypothetical protein
MMLAGGSDEQAGGGNEGKIGHHKA